jgi:hypothetical protein
MKRKKGGSAAAKKKQSEPENVLPSTNQSQMQLVVFQEHSGTGTSAEPPEPVRGEQGQQAETPIIEDDESMSVDETEPSDGDNDDYSIEHDPGLRAPISSYDVNGQDSVRRAYIALGPCQPKMNREDFPQHDCGGMHRFQP